MGLRCANVCDALGFLPVRGQQHLRVEMQYPRSARDQPQLAPVAARNRRRKRSSQKTYVLRSQAKNFGPGCSGPSLVRQVLPCHYSEAQLYEHRAYVQHEDSENAIGRYAFSSADPLDERGDWLSPHIPLIRNFP